MGPQVRAVGSRELAQACRRSRSSVGNGWPGSRICFLPCSPSPWALPGRAPRDVVTGSAGQVDGEGRERLRGLHPRESEPLGALCSPGPARSSPTAEKADLPDF